jgi:hypothetical protein
MRIVCVMLLTACGGSSPSPREVLGPFTGETRRYVVSAITVPEDRFMFADDLNGDGKPDNQLGNIVGALAAESDLSAAVNDIVAAGGIASSVEIVAGSGDTAGVRYLDSDDAAVPLVGGTWELARYRSNRTRQTKHPVTMRVRLPLWADADPAALTVEGVELDLDPDGAGYRGVLRGVLAADEVMRVAWAGFLQMLRDRPHDHGVLVDIVDTDHDGVIPLDEFASNSVFLNVLHPDVQMHDAAGDWAPTPTNARHDSLSIAFGFELVPCDAGRCSTATPSQPCRDRVRDGDESDVDCGGTCGGCAGGAACRAGGDCQSRRCDGGRCAEPTCSDGAWDGFESDVDCGGPTCPPCAVGQGCFSGDDCPPRSSCTGLFTRGACEQPR